ncbi:MAG: peptidoglycan DD-metalloendopeptidase family protein [Methylomonas sp.]|jgi:septal ring factor EnvC (AmiA/AmiB activator)|uniref:murein hydrolase activator EnvC family protein n=1 Tax=Methylomonas sp. TaxID=418 RepID=UPI0025E1EABC|nr:peptidoglycan DD-metalloendopeptidase family protein [Methylomonas sp.]MCK9607724.1 peptidoglycan DD-metalloendopeptidase family protein [Methylomonas sp.]
MKIRFYVLLAFACVSPGLWAESDAAKARELAKVQAKIKQVGADVKKLAAEKTARIAQLRKLESQYGEQVNALDAIKSEIQQQEQALRDVRNKIVATEKDLQAQQDGLQGLVKSAHAMSHKEGLDVLLNQRDPALSGRMLVYFDYMSKARLQKLQAIEDDFRTLRQLEAQKDTESQLLQVALEKKQQETDALKLLKQQRENLLAQINQEHVNKRDQLVSLMHDEKKLTALVASLQKTDDNGPQTPPPEPVVEKKPAIIQQRPLQAQSNKAEKRTIPLQMGKAFAELRGQLPWPVQGAIVERFGSRRFETTWDGTVIGAREGAAIRAVAAGRVVYADWLRGYGLMLIVDHGKGFMSLYAFNQSLHKSVGEYVKTGDVLASVGRSGGRSSAALYFGIRQKGRAVDPEKWCRKPGKG